MALDEEDQPRRARSGKLALVWTTVPLTVIGGLAFWYVSSPVNTLNLLCSYDVNARVSAEIEVGGKKMTGSAVFQNSRSRRWISIMNAAGCTQPYGNTIAFRLPNDRVLLVPTRLCRRAMDIVDRSGSADVLNTCNGRNDHQNWAVLVDSATRPGKWRVAANGVEFKLLQMTAASTWANPSDNVSEVAPNLLRSDLQRAKVKWRQRADQHLPYRRRARHKVRGQPFDFTVSYGSFALN